MPLDLRSQTVLVTGASSGIGAAFARRLAERGASLVLVARREDRLRDLAAELRPSRVEIAATDLSAPGAVGDLVDRLAERHVVPTGLINNAGFGTFGLFADDELDTVRDEVAVNVLAPVELTRSLLPLLLAAEHPFIVNVASMAAYTPTPRMAVYGATKAFVLSFTEALWAEMRDSHLKVLAVSPGATATEFNEVVGTDDATSGARMRTPEDVVDTALRALDAPDAGPSVVDGGGNRLAATATRLLPRRRAALLMARLTDPRRRDEPVAERA